jgi:hypothetical protein
MNAILQVILARHWRWTFKQRCVPYLRIVVMSATLDGERIAQWMDAPRISSPGRSFPVRIEYPPARAQESVEHHLARIAKQALEESAGDLLAFLPGRREIARAENVLSQTLQRDDVEIVALHGELSLAEQQLALAPAEEGTRRIVLATNVAESSVTLPGIRTVVDTGLAREPRFDPNSGFTRLETVTFRRHRPISAPVVLAAWRKARLIGSGRKAGGSIPREPRRSCRRSYPVSPWSLPHGAARNCLGLIHHRAVHWHKHASC